METTVRKWIGLLWVTLGIVWVIGALTQKQTVRREPARSRLVHLFFGALVVILLFDKRVGPRFLREPFVPNAAVFLYPGLALTIAGIAFAIWARIFLGGNWSGAVTLKKDHELVRKGPYALVRNPIYTGALLALLGTAIVFRGTRGLLAVGVAVIALCIKIRREELFMAEQFGMEYAQYKQKVRKLIPFVW